MCSLNFYLFQVNTMRRQNRASVIAFIASLKNNFRENIFCFLLSSLGFVFYLWVFVRNPLIPGIDGPYYLIQVRSLLQTGKLVYGDPPLTFYLLAFFCLAFRRSNLRNQGRGLPFLCALFNTRVLFG